MYKVCLIEGDGVGPEVIESARQILDALKVSINFQYATAGYNCFLKCGTSIPNETISIARQADAVLFGAVTSPPNIPNYKSAIITLRRELDLFANIRPTKSFPVEISRPNIDFIIVRENTEDLYVGDEEVFSDYAISKRKISRFASERIIRYACKMALREGRKKITVVHKANVLRATDGLFVKVAEEVLSNFPELNAEYMLVDTAAMHLILNPDAFSVIVTTNMFGDILSDEAAALVGGLGLAASANIGEQHALFEPVHGSAPDIAGKGIVNPMATIIASAMMLDYLGEAAASKKIYCAVENTLKNKIFTPDLGGNYSTKQVCEMIISELNAG